MLLEFAAHDVAQRHLGGADLRADDLEPAGDVAALSATFALVERASEIGVLGHGRDDGHQVRLARAVVADDQQPLLSLGLSNCSCGRPSRRAARPCGRR